MRTQATRAQLTDYGEYYRSSGAYDVYAPATLEHVAALVRRASDTRTPLRVRGNAHSMNGGAVPRDGEMLLLTRELCAYRFESDETVTVGAGAAVWDLDAALAAHGCELLVCNDGGAPAASVGGFVAAGGFGATSAEHGGFWETVEALTVVAGDGRILRVARDDERFPWFFGAMGRLGVVCEATLRVRPRAGSWPVTRTGRHGLVTPSVYTWEKIVWYSAFVPQRVWKRAARELAELGAPHAHVWTARPQYAYAIPFRTFTPPLIHPLQENLVAIGIWGTPPASDGFDFAALRLLDRDITAWLRANPEYRRYVQAELVFDDFRFEDHVDAAARDRFAELQHELDPGRIIAPGPFARAQRQTRRAAR